MSKQSRANVTLDVPKLDEGLNRLELRARAADLELHWQDAEFADSVELALDVVRMGDDLQIDCRFRGSMQVVCDRCTKAYEQLLSGKLRVLGRRGDENTHELGHQDGVVFHDGHVVDLTGEIRQAILLEIPIQNLCAEDCRGLCRQCGTDLNTGECSCPPPAVDPRWAALEGHRSEDSPGS